MKLILRPLRRKLRSLIQWASRSDTPDFARCDPSAELMNPILVTHPQRVRIGAHVYIGPGASLSTQGGLVIHDGVIIGPYLHVYTANHNYNSDAAVPYDGTIFLQPVVIQRNVWIGGDVVIMPGVTIGEGAVVAGGAVVARDVPPLSVVGGCPAKVIKQRDRASYEKCAQAGRLYLALKRQGRMPAVESPPWDPAVLDDPPGRN